MLEIIEVIIGPFIMVLGVFEIILLIMCGYYLFGTVFSLFKMGAGSEHIMKAGEKISGWPDRFRNYKQSAKDHYDKENKYHALKKNLEANLARAEIDAVKRLEAVVNALEQVEKLDGELGV